MIVGMTGSRSGVTPEQMAIFRALLLELGATELHHGDCVGADTQAHEVARELGLWIVVHPPLDQTWRAFCVDVNDFLPARDYLDRNRDIVDACDVLLALPDRPETLRSGTWSTIRYARRIGRQTEVII